MSTNSDTAIGGATPEVACARRVFRLPLTPRLLSLFGAIILAGTTLMMAALAALLLPKQWTVGLAALACAGLMGALTGHVWRDLRGKWGLRVILDANTVTLNLPAGRSLIHRPPAQHLIVPYADIEAIDARFEAYGSLGMEIMQRAYVLRRKDGELIFLFEERALATFLASSQFADILADLVARAKVPLRELGTVEGKGGLLSVWGTHAPDWAAPPLSRDRAIRLWRHAATTGAFAMFIVVFAFMVEWATGLLHW
jgi:hypothetical protein